MVNTTLPQFHFVSLFPQTIDVWFGQSVLGRAREKGLFQVCTHQLREFAIDANHTVDDCPYGGGSGMVLKIEPLVAAIENVQHQVHPRESFVVHFSPGGKLITQAIVEKLHQVCLKKALVLICGRYEGVDQRFVDGWVDEELSLGRFVMTGGEISAIALVDAIARRIEGVLGNPESLYEESFSESTGYDQTVEYPQYTRPREFRGHTVPAVLLTGNHQQIAKWRKERSRERTPIQVPI